MALEDLSTPARVDEPRDDRATLAAATRRLVDSDAHLDPPHEMWKDYLPERFRDLAPVIEEGDEHDWVVFEGNRRPLKMINNTAGRDNKDWKMHGKRSQMRAAWEPAYRLKEMDIDGIDAAVLFGGGPLPTTDTEFYIASFDAYNRYLWDFCGADRRRLTGVAYLPMRDLDETMDLLHKAARLGFRAVNIPAFPQSADGVTSSARVKAIAAGQGAALTGNPASGKAYRDPEYERFWGAVSDYDLTVTIHLGGRTPRFGEKQHFMPDMVMSKLAMAEPVGILIFGGVFARFPKLRFATVESGVGWFGWAAEFMDRMWERQRYWMDSPITELPSAFMDRNVYGSFINDRFGILARNMPGAGNIMWSSDYPHSETSYPNSHAVIARDFAGVPDEDIDEICCNRAARLYGFD